jgi:hypothetical protein
MRLPLFIILVLYQTDLFTQSNELSIIIQPGLYFSKMSGNDNGTFRKNNQVASFTNWGLRYKHNKNSIALAYTNFPIEIDLNLSAGNTQTGTNGQRFTTIPIYVGREIFTLLQNRIGIDLQVGSNLLFGNIKGFSGGSGTGLNNGTIPVDATWDFSRHYNRSFGIIPFLGVEFRNVQLKKVDLSFGYRRFIGVQQLGETRIEYKSANEPVRNYTLESRGTGNVIFLSASIRVWRKVKENKMITSPFDYPKKIITVRDNSEG